MERQVFYRGIARQMLDRLTLDAKRLVEEEPLLWISMREFETCVQGPKAPCVFWPTLEKL